MPAIPGHIHSRLLEARDLWAKAEASALPTDTAVAYMLFSQHNGKIRVCYFDLVSWYPQILIWLMIAPPQEDGIVPADHTS